MYKRQSIGSGEYLNSRLLARILTSFREKHPGVKYDIYSGNSDNIKERIERGILDIGFLLEPVDIRKYEFVRSPVREEWGVLVDVYKRQQRRYEYERSISYHNHRFGCRRRYCAFR